MLYITVMMIAAKRGIELKMVDWLWDFAGILLAVLLPLSLGGIGIRKGAFVGVLGYLQVPGKLWLARSLTIIALQVFIASAGTTLDFPWIGKNHGNR